MQDEVEEVEESIEKQLQKPFSSNSLEWRVQQEVNGSALVLAYVTSRAVMQRLDDVIGIGNWQDEYIISDEGMICQLSIWSAEHSQWITKQDGAERTKVEKFKGGLSDSFKRVAVKFGIGRYLYAMPTKWVRLSKNKKDGENYHKGKDGNAYYWNAPKMSELPVWARVDNSKSNSK